MDRKTEAWQGYSVPSTQHMIVSPGQWLVCPSCVLSEEPGLSLLMSVVQIVCLQAGQSAAALTNVSLASTLPRRLNNSLKLCLGV